MKRITIIGALIGSLFVGANGNSNKNETRTEALTEIAEKFFRFEKDKWYIGREYQKELVKATGTPYFNNQPSIKSRIVFNHKPYSDEILFYDVF